MKPSPLRVSLPLLLGLFAVQTLPAQVLNLNESARSRITSALNGGGSSTAAGSSSSTSTGSGSAASGSAITGSSGGSTETEKSDTTAALMLKLAMSSPDYRVTPGDVYTLAYAAGTTPITYGITVDSSYRIRVSNLGVVDAAGKTYSQLKAQVEAVVANNYPLSGAQLILTSPGVFRVFVKGEVQGAVEMNAWALSRLSEVLSGNLTDYSSLRDVSIRAVGGQVKVYDLYRAIRGGDLREDPYLRPGDVISVQRAARTVTLEGEVERPGTYQLLPGEELRDLIENYGSGFTPLAETERIGLTRFVNARDRVGNKLYLAEAAVAENFPLENYDSIEVPSTVDERPVLFVEGAVGASDEGNLTASNRITVRFEPGENYGPLVRRNPDWFSAVSDTRNAYIIRREERLPLNLNPLLYDAQSRSPYGLEPNDTLVIPFRQYFVTVSGAVVVPGRYPYIPDRNWEYYIALAGGFREEENAAQKVTIKGIDGRVLKKSGSILPETIINAESNAFLYHFNRLAPFVSTTLGIITAFISIQALLAR